MAVFDAKGIMTGRGQNRWQKGKQEGNARKGLWKEKWEVEVRGFFLGTPAVPPSQYTPFDHPLSRTKISPPRFIATDDESQQSR
mmetsp:Transcript_71841/g.126567  ORF Transcript_71841/g.126567 Transcript_71841/m.126567 type:complete len:84 (-) Transcript_71841:471-722(-)